MKDLSRSPPPLLGGSPANATIVGRFVYEAGPLHLFGQETWKTGASGIWSMPSFSEGVKLNTALRLSYRPVAIFVGGTSGIGQGIAERFAHYMKGNAHIIIIGRNQAAAEKTISTFPRTSESQYEFIPSDISLLKNVVDVCSQLKSRLAAVNYLVCSQGVSSMNQRIKTAEGLDLITSLHFYSRWKFVDEVIPLLQKASDLGQEARVMSVLAAGYGGDLNTHDLGLQRTYSLISLSHQLPTYNDLFVEEYAERHPNLSFTHIFPGFVDTPVFQSNWIISMVIPFAKLFASTPKTCGEMMVTALWSPTYKVGHHHLGSSGEPVSPHKIHTSSEARKLFVGHYNQVTSI